MITRHAVLGGMKHCGKSTQGRKLAAFWSVPFYDTDTLIEEAYAKASGTRLSCREIFREKGENYFRQREAEVIRALAAAEMPEGRVIALGGGVPANHFIPEDDIRKLGFFIFLELDEAAAFRRVQKTGLPAYLESEPDPAKAFSILYFKRVIFYRHFSECTVPVLESEDEETVFRNLVRSVEEA